MSTATGSTLEPLSAATAANAEFVVPATGLTQNCLSAAHRGSFDHWSSSPAPRPTKPPMTVRTPSGDFVEHCGPRAWTSNRPGFCLNKPKALLNCHGGALPPWPQWPRERRSKDQVRQLNAGMAALMLSSLHFALSTFKCEPSTRPVWPNDQVAASTHYVRPTIYTKTIATICISKLPACARTTRILLPENVAMVARTQLHGFHWNVGTQCTKTLFHARRVILNIYSYRRCARPRAAISQTNSRRLTCNAA